jgi:hypothetical protein
MSKTTPAGLTGIYKCPACGSTMKRKERYPGGTASYWEITAVSSSSTVAPYIYYPEQDVYECTNPHCKHTLLIPRRK